MPRLHSHKTCAGRSIQEVADSQAAAKTTPLNVPDASTHTVAYKQTSCWEFDPERDNSSRQRSARSKNETGEQKEQWAIWTHGNFIIWPINNPLGKTTIRHTMCTLHETAQDKTITSPSVSQ